jgi:hypothetical protein
MIKTSLTTLVLLFGLAARAANDDLILVTEGEAKASQAAGGMLTPRASAPPGAPKIELVAPDLKKSVNVPTKIDLRFFGTPPGEPNPETFRAFYGAFRIDITRRLLGAAKVTKEGISVPQAVLPAGRHQLLLTLTDTMGRETQQVMAFTVE